jgi:thioredoxin-like negative regulator of GroEL
VSARQHASGRLHFMRVNVDDNPNVASGLSVMSILSIVVFDSTGCEIDRLVGLPSLHRLDQLVAHATTAAAGSDRSGS